MAVRASIEIEGGQHEVADRLRLIGDALAGNLVEKPSPCEVVGCEEHADIDEQFAKVREDLATKTLDLDNARIFLADTKSELAISEETIASLRREVQRLEKQLEVDARVIEGLHERLKDSPAALLPSQVRPPVSVNAAGVAGDVVSEEQLFGKGVDETHKEPRADGKRVAGEEGHRNAREQDPEAPGEEQDREAGAGRLAGGESGNGGPPTVPAAANATQPRWARTADKGAAFHAWASIDDGEAVCGETTDAEVFPVPEGEKPPAEEACVDCADLTGWAEPTRLSKLPVQPQTELGLGPAAKPDDGKRPCARCSHPTKRFCSSESTVVGPWLPFRGKPLCSKCSGVLRDQEKAQKPRCKGFNKAAGVACGAEPKPGLEFCGRHAPKATAATQEASGG